MSNGQSLQGDNGPVQTACNLVSTAVSLEMCAGLAATLASPTAVAPAALANEGAGLAMVSVIPKLAQRFL